MIISTLNGREPGTLHKSRQTTPPATPLPSIAPPEGAKCHECHGGAGPDALTSRKLAYKAVVSGRDGDGDRSRGKQTARQDRQLQHELVERQRNDGKTPIWGRKKSGKMKGQRKM